jgi:16S rRNA (guanine527-N7)-methyltransferase
VKSVFKKTIKNWFADRSLEIDDALIDRVGIYHDLIIDWSRRMNLVSRNDFDNIIERHFLDSLTPIKEIRRTGHLVDVGSGAGFPAIPIALMRPELGIVMIESIRKKVVFLNEAISRLSLERVSVWHGRLEDFSPIKKYDIATIRAVAITEKLRKHLERVIKDTGKIIYYNKFNEYRLI